MNENLKPCPFCGGENLLIMPKNCDKRSEYNHADRAFPLIRCIDCGATVEGANWSNPKNAIAAWNRRHGAKPLTVDYIEDLVRAQNRMHELSLTEQQLENFVEAIHAAMLPDQSARIAELEADCEHLSNLNREALAEISKLKLELRLGVAPHAQALAVVEKLQADRDALLKAILLIQELIQPEYCGPWVSEIMNILENTISEIKGETK